MATILYVGTHGTDDPTRASLPFHAATGAIEAGHEPQIALLGDATYLAKPSVVAAVQGVAMPSLAELLAKVKDHGAPVYVWGGCGKARGVLEGDLGEINGKFITPTIFAELTVAADKVVTF